MQASPDASPGSLVETACDHIVVGVDQGGLWIGAPPDLKCFAPRKAGAVDLAWLASELRVVKGALDPTCVPLVEYRGADVELSGVRDVVTKVGLTDRALRFDGSTPPDPADLVSNLAAPSRAPTRCPTPARAGPVHPIIVITPTEISVIAQGRALPVASIADVAHTTDTLPGLAAVLGAPTSDQTFVVQAEKDTHAAILNRVIHTARQGGFARMVMAVNQ